MVGCVRILFLALALSFPFTGYAQVETASDSASRGGHALDTLKHSGLPIDSVGSALQGPDSLQNILSAGQLRPPDKLDSLEMSYRRKADSLQSLGLPHEKYLQKIDSLSQLPDRKVTEKIESWKSKANEKLDEWKDKGTQKVGANLPEGADTPNIDPLEDPLNANLEDKLNLPGENAEAGALTEELPIENPVNADLLDEPTELGGIKQQISDVQEAPQSAVENVKDEVGIDATTSKIDEYTSKIGETTDQLAEAKEGDLTGVEEKIQEKALNEFDEVSALNEQKGLLEQTRAEHEEYLQLQKDYLERVQQYSDPEFVQQRIKEKSKYIANDRLVQYQSKVEDAQEDLRQVKVDTTDRALNVHAKEDWPLKQRWLAGANLEVFRNESVQLDVAPYLGFQMNDRWHIYGGYLYRIYFDPDKSQFNANNPVYGPRIATTYRFFKGFYVRLSADQLRTYVPSSSVNTEQGREWVRSFYLGLGNRYSISRHTKGTVQIMYNFSHDRDSPFPNSFNIRMGFEVDFKKRTTRKDVIEGLEKVQRKKRALESIKKKRLNH